MAKPIHHAILKRATKLGCALVEVPEGGFRIEAKGRLSQDTFDDAKEALNTFALGGMEFEARKGNFCGVMVASYHAVYECNPHGPGCGDGLDIAMRDAFTHDSGVDVEALQKLGESLGLWNPSWFSLNPGMKRMNLTNRIRAYLRNRADAKVQIGDKTGRHGVAYKPAGKTRPQAKAA